MCILNTNTNDKSNKQNKKKKLIIPINNTNMYLIPG